MSSEKADSPQLLAEPELVTVKCELVTYSDEENGAIDELASTSSNEVVVKLERINEENNDDLDSTTLKNSEPVTKIENPAESAADKQVLLQTAKGYVLSDKSTSATPGRNECPVCHKTLATPSGLQRHLANHTRDTLDCQYCYRQFLRQDLLDRHVRSAHERPTSYPCAECGKAFKSKSNLHQHQKSHLPVQPYSCATCRKQFAVPCHLRKHLAQGKCRSPGSLRCTLCRKQFDRELLLQRHLKYHQESNLFFCDICEMSFTFKSALTRHILLHNGHKPFKCKYCSKRFTSFGLMKPHLRKHTGERPYQCAACPKAFAHKQNMLRHMERHSRVKNLVCEVCHKAFPKESRLKYHMRTHLVDKRPFKCGVCLKAYSHRQNIQRHYRKKHPGDTYDCKVTDASVASVIWDALQRRKREEEGEGEGAKEGEDAYILP